MEEKHKIKYWIIIIILIIIILLLLFFARFGKIDNNSNLVPTGNVDVFDIDINCKCDTDNPCTNNNDNNDGKDNKDNKDNDERNGIPVYNEESSNVLGKVFVDDSNGNYIYQQNLRIFENSAFNFTNKIAPGVSNTYHFVVHNSTNVKLKYYLEMYESSEYTINLRYRLKRGNNYVVGSDNNWVSANELKTAFMAIDANSSDNYSLDWQWMYDDDKDNQDTIAGEQMTSTYKLNVRFYFEQIGE